MSTRDEYIPRATADKLAADFPKGTRHQAKVDIATALISNGMAPVAVAAQLRVKFPESRPGEVEDVVDWVAKNISPSPADRVGYRPSGNGGYRPPAPSAPVRGPIEQMDWWLNGLRLTQEQLFELSPVTIPPDSNQALALAIDSLYQDTDRLNIVTKFILDPKGKANPTGVGTTMLKEDWLMSFACDGIPSEQAGAWFRINPVSASPSGKHGGYTDNDITAFRYFLIEFDNTPLPTQLAFFYKIKLPVAAVLMSGGKSIHAWVKIGAINQGQYDERAKLITELLKPFGSDIANKNPSRLSRLPEARRVVQAVGDGIQKLLFLNPLVPELTADGLKRFEESLKLPVIAEKPMLALAQDAITRYDYLRANKGKLGVPIGIPDLDELSGGMKAGQTIVVAGATGGCKTTMAIHATISALTANYGVLMFSLEMDKEEIFDLMMSNYCSIHRNKFNNGFFSDYDMEVIGLQLPKMATLPLFIEDAAMNSVDQIQLRTMQLVTEGRIGLVVVDYIQFVNPSLTRESREQQIAQISHGLRVITRQARIPMIVLSQLNDDGKLRESRVIAHNANTVLMVNVDGYQLKIDIVKGRGVPLGTYYLGFERDYARLVAIKDKEDSQTSSLL